MEPRSLLVTRHDLFGTARKFEKVRTKKFIEWGIFIEIFLAVAGVF